MKLLKNEKGFTLIDITVAIIVVLLFMSLISIIFFNLTKSSKEIERESQATYIATNIIEAYKSLDYDSATLTSGIDGDSIVDGQTIGTQVISIPEGYSAKVKVERYTPQGENADNDLVKKITVTVSYKIAANTKHVQLETSIVR